MDEYKVIGELSGKNNKIERWHSFKRGHTQLIEVRKGYARQDISLPRMDKDFVVTIRELSKVPMDLRAGNEPHFIKTIPF